MPGQPLTTCWNSAATEALVWKCAADQWYAVTEDKKHADTMLEADAFAVM